MNVKVSVIERLKRKDEKAFDEVYHAYKKLVYYILKLYIKNNNICIELMQDIFTKVYLEIDKLKENKAFHSWIISITKNVALEYLRKERLETNFINTYFEKENLVINPKNDLSEYYTKDINDLEKAILTLHFIYNMTFKEISNQLNITKDVAAKTYYQSLEKIKKCVKGEEYEKKNN